MKMKLTCIILSMLFLPACHRETYKTPVESPVVELSRAFTFVESCNREDPLLQEILREDMKGKKSPLELIHYYAEILNKGKSHGKIGEKLDTLFLCGRPPGDMDGYYHGVTISLKTGLDICTVLDDARRKLGIKEDPDILQALYGKVFSKTSPWAGKSFKKNRSEEVRRIDGELEREQRNGLSWDKFLQAGE